MSRPICNKTIGQQAQRCPSLRHAYCTCLSQTIPPTTPLMAVLRHSAAFPFLLLLALLICIPALVSGVWLNDGGGGVEEEGEQFSEELFLKPLPDRKVLAHFHFQSTAPPSAANGRHHHLFPKAIAQLVLL